MEDLLLERWNSKYVTGDKQVEQQGLLGFKNTVAAIEMLKRHIDRKSKIAVHCDVDLDGVGCGYILKAFLRSQGINTPLFIINKDKIHGIQQKHADYFKINKIDLLIVVDSSSNELETLNNFNGVCDVLVIDHHEIGHNETHIKGEHECVIVNNMIDNSDVSEINEWLVSKLGSDCEKVDSYIAEERMSGALVVYEILRTYCKAYRLGSVLENLMLYQWVACTLLSDAVLCVTDRNQWYMDKTVHSMEVESCLKIILGELNSFKATLDKSFISFTLAPTLNKTIRAGASGEALDILLNRPKDIKQLDVYKEMQANAVEKGASKDAIYRDDFIIKDITDLGISKNYCGVIASGLCGDNYKNTIVFIRDGDKIAGSFRGRFSKVDYRGFFLEYDESVFAQGHKAAFGFKATIEQARDIMSKLSTIEPERAKFYLTAGSIQEDLKGTYHIDDMMEFKRLGYFWRLAVANSKLSSEEQLEIVTSSAEAVLSEVRGKLYVYDILGLKCKAFEPITTKLVTIYIECSSSIEMYIRNYNIK